MILITGASGKLGRKIVTQLEKAGEPLRLLVRDRNRAPEVKGIEIVEGDYSDRPSLKRAFSGVQKAFIVSLHEKPMERAELHRNAFEAAHQAALEYVVYTSFQGVAEDASFNMARDHYQSEIFLKESGLHFTALRNSFYAETAHQHVDEKGFLRSPSGDGRVAWVARDDIAEVVARLLLDPPPTSEFLDVTGPEAPKLTELAVLLAKLSGLHIRYADETYDEGLAWRKAVAKDLGLAEWDLEAWMSGCVAMGSGETGTVSDTVQRITGHRATSLCELYAKDATLIENLKEMVAP